MTLVRTRAKAAKGSPNTDLESDQLALKILANATSYGIFVEFNVSTADRAEPLVRYGVEGLPCDAASKVFEEPGQYFHPVVATLITGAARLMLALTERLALDQGLSWVFCDTDSMAIARPDEMDLATFNQRTVAVRDWFSALNPYAAHGPLLQIEDVNFRPGHAGDMDALEPLYCYAVSSKRYVEFNLAADGAPVIRKGSAHGLGHLLPPYPDPDRGARMKAMSVEKWQEDLWLAIIRSALDGDGVKLALDYHPGMASPAASRYAATTPALLDWFRTYNDSRTESEKVRPFNFLLAFHSLKLEQLASNDPEAAELWQSQRRDPRPAAPYNRDPVAGAEHAFDRESGEPVPARWLESYGRNLAQYHLHREVKFWGGEWTESGPLRRRHVEAIAVEHIGKEADRWEEQQYVGAEDDDQPNEYGLTNEARAELIEVVRKAVKKFKLKRLAKAARISDNTLAATIRPGASIRDRLLRRLAEAIDQLETDAADEDGRRSQLLDWVRAQVELDGAPAVAALLAYDVANLRKVLADGRRPSAALLAQIEFSSDAHNRSHDER